MKQPINEIKRMQQLAGINEIKIPTPGGKDGVLYRKLKNAGLFDKYFDIYEIYDYGTALQEIEAYEIQNNLAYEIAKEKGFKGSFGDLVNNEELNSELNRLADSFVKQFAKEKFNIT